MSVVGKPVASKRRGRQLQTVPAGHPVFAVAPGGGRGKYRWVVYADREQAHWRYDDDVAACLLSRPDPLGVGVEPSREECLERVAEIAPHAIQVGQYAASYGSLSWLERREDMRERGHALYLQIRDESAFRAFVTASHRRAQQDPRLGLRDLIRELENTYAAWIVSSHGRPISDLGYHDLDRGTFSSWTHSNTHVYAYVLRLLLGAETTRRLALRDKSRRDDSIGRVGARVVERENVITMKDWLLNRRR